jgi:hypothetical protein
MKFDWFIEPSDIRAVQNVVAEQDGRRLPVDRLERNVNGSVPEIGRSELWRAHLMCLLTSQQRSGPNRPVSDFLNQEPFPFSLRSCKNAKNLNSFVSSTLTAFGGIRFADTIGERAATNLERLEAGGWHDSLTWVRRLRTQRLRSPRQEHYQLERQAAAYMREFRGFGPKQSRNFWQALGLSRYEFVLDSRITRWLKKSAFPVPLSSEALGDEQYYSFLSDILRRLCADAGVLPCVFDAAVFASYDELD